MKCCGFLSSVSSFSILPFIFSSARANSDKKVIESGAYRLLHLFIIAVSLSFPLPLLAGARNAETPARR